MTIETNDVVLRYLRFRVGRSTIGSCCKDGISIYRGSNVVFDHLSISWSTDENTGSWYEARNVTFSNCLSSEALYNANHADVSSMPDNHEPHSMGAL
jgi:hypothetical protein